ncbi:MAG TPA: MMPL family transporter [Chloroflexia bacterium]|nr:MMPL family transporter [Chloroflexia bacterium]
MSQSTVGTPRKKLAATVRVAMWSARHRWLVVACWFIFSLGLFGISIVIGTRSSDVTGNSASARLEASKADAAFSAGGGSAESSDTFVVVLSNPSVKATDPAYKALVQQIIKTLQGATYTAADGQNQPVFTTVLDPYNPLLGQGLISQDGSSVRVIGSLTGDYNTRKAKLTPVRPALDAIKAQQPSFQVYAYNGLLINEDFNKHLFHELDGSLRITLPLTFIILLIAFGAVAAALVPLVLAVTALLAAFGLMSIYSQLVNPVDSYASEVIVLIGLAVGIDYSLFMITRYRTERRRGRDKLHAIEIASSTAGRAVFFSGLTVMISLAGLFMVGESIFSSIASGTIGVVLVAVIGSLTFLPATLAILGNGVNWGRIPYFGRERDEGSGFWAKIVGGVMRRPAIFMVVTAVLLLALASPILHLKLGTNGIDGLPDSLEGIKALRLMNQKWPQGTTLTMQVVVTGADRADTKAAIDQFKTAALAVPGLSGPAQVTPSKDGKVARISLYMAGSRNSQANQDIVQKTRKELVPQYFGPLDGVQAYVGGSAAYTLDQVNFYLGAMPMVFGFVLAFSFLLLLLAFHSLVIPVKAIILNLLSTGASYGAMVLVFQDGWFSDQIGFKPTGVIENFAPLFMFTILFGLSMDYHLFILTRIKEIKDQGASSVEAVAKGISITSGVITSAAAIMVVVFAVFVTLEIIIVRQLGLGLAVAVFVDATIIRSILLPATMRLLGDWNWWIPKWLDWLPQVNIEGEVAHSTHELVESEKASLSQSEL